jgi:hypothetical protein
VIGSVGGDTRSFAKGRTSGAPDWYQLAFADCVAASIAALRLV